MPLELLKVICQVVVLERDDDGNPIGERSSEPVAIYDPSGFDVFLANVRAELAAQRNGGEPKPIAVE